jgi:hypothetical protein
MSITNMPAFIPGLELSRRFYTEAVRPLLEEASPAIPHSAARLGSGSEVLGFDTPRSADHEWGPRLQLFLRRQDVSREQCSGLVDQLLWRAREGRTFPSE